MLGEAITAEHILITSIPTDIGLFDYVSAEASAIAAVTMGFSTDPVARWFYPEPAEYFHWFPKFVRAFAGGSISGGSAYCTSSYSGAALWLRPGVHPDEEAMVAIVEESLPKERHAAVFELFEKMGEGHPAEPHWYLPMIGVDTFQQNRGIGSALMRYALERCDAENLPAYLESSNPRNIPLYLRFGFEQVGEISAGGSPSMVPMLRKPRGNNS